ncbi:hypothetical protein B9Z55_011047 [Caenorhabditis nigoni]|nr:hypothetical protein B9Z55_016376 [Caenorhabditis nigoni]PIC39321.1 hypothetical protein B9Z55_011047 [Caenorhabditis nigoni]
MVGKKPEDLHRELRRLRNEDPEGEYVIQAFKNSRVDELNDWIAANSPKSVQIETLTECPSCTRLPRNGHKKKSLTLVIGGRVVITDNHGLEDPSLANGVSGVLLAVGRNFLSIRRTDNGKEVRITRFKYTNSNRKAEGVWFQYPVAMAEAMSVHKGQGSTCDGSVIDSDGMTNEAMFYTALSRNKSLAQTKVVDVRNLRYKGSGSARLQLEMIRERTERIRGGK